MKPEEQPEIAVPFKGMIVTPANAVVLILEDNEGRDLLKIPDGVEVNVKLTARTVRDGVEQEANRHVLSAAIGMVVSMAEELKRGGK